MVTPTESTRYRREPIDLGPLGRGGEGPIGPIPPNPLILKGINLLTPCTNTLILHTWHAPTTHPPQQLISPPGRVLGVPVSLPKKHTKKQDNKTMAKLSARNRTELWRMERTKATSLAAPDNPEPHSYDVVSETKRYAAMSDGHLLCNTVLVWRDGMRHNYGWKVQTGKFTQEQFTACKAKLEAVGFSAKGETE